MIRYIIGAVLMSAVITAMAYNQSMWEINVLHGDGVSFVKCATLSTVFSSLYTAFLYRCK